MKIFLLLVILNYSVFASGNLNENKSTEVSSQEKVIELSEQENELKKIILKEIEEKIKKNDEKNLTLTYNIDQIYKNANDFYDNAFKQFIEEIKWILAIFLGVIGLLKIKDIFDKNEIKKRLNSFEDKIRKEYENEIEKMNNLILKGEFNREKIEIIYEENKNEKKIKIGKLESKIENEYLFFDNKEKKEAYIFIGRELEKINEDSQAINSYTKALTYERIDEIDIIAYNNRGILKDKKGLYDEALEDYKKSIELKEDESPYRNLVLLYLDLEKYEEALKYIEIGIAKFPKSSSLSSVKGLIEARQKNYYKAIENYTRAIILNSNNKEAYFNRSIAYNEINENLKAMKDLFYLIEINQEGDNVFTNIGYIFFQEKKYKEALKYYKKALNKNEFNKEALLGKLNVYEKTNQKELSKELLEEYFLKNTNIQDWAYSKYAELIMDENPKKALEFIKKAIEIATGNFEYYYQKAHIELKIGNKKEALKSFEIVSCLNPEDDICYHDIGYLKYELEEYEKAIPYFEKAIKLNDKRPDYYNSKGVCLESIGDIKSDINLKKEYYLKALQDFKIANEIDNRIMFFKNINRIERKISGL